MYDVDGLNAGYEQALLEEYLDNPAAVPEEWRELFESGGSELVAAHPALRRLLETLEPETNGRAAAAAAVPESAAEPDQLLLGAVAAAMALVKAYRMHG